MRTTCPQLGDRALSTNIARARSTIRLGHGVHGLPLMGGGDWNDGMNRVGHEGQRRKRMAGLVSSRHCDSSCPSRWLAMMAIAPGTGAGTSSA